MADIGIFVQQTITGLANGGGYALVALGFVLIFGVANVLNIAHAETVMLAPYATIWMVDGFGLPLLVALPVGILLAVGAGIVIHLVVVRPFVLRQRRQGDIDHLAPLIATFGAALAISQAVGQYGGTQARSFPWNLASSVWHLGSVLVSPAQALTLVVAGLISAVLGIVLVRTHFGRSLRAVAEDPAVSESIGIDVDRVVMATTAIAALAGGVAGLLFAAGTNSVTPFMGIGYGLKGLVVMIVGGVSSPLGAVVAGLLLGLAEAYVIGYSSSSYVTVVTFGLLFVVLLLRPRGLIVAASREMRP